MNHDPRCTLCRPDPLSLAYRSRHGGRDDFYVTLFRNKSGGSLTYAWRPLAELREMILATTAGDKHDLPLLKLARFGGKRSKNGSLRHDANVTAISGIEADYDAKQISFDDAVATVARARLMAIVYTSPGHAASAPKWRVLLPTLSASAPSERARLVARINGVFGGAFAGESFTLSQAYYFGHVNSNPDHRAVVVDGDFIDRRDDLDAGAIGKAGRQHGNGHAFDPNERVDDDVLVNRVVYGESYHPSLVSLAARHIGRGETVEAVVAALRALMDRAVAPHDDRWHHNYGDIPRTVRSAAEFVARKSDEDREADVAIAASVNDPVVDARMMAELAARTANAEDRKSIGEDARTGHLGNHLPPDSATNDAGGNSDNVTIKPDDAAAEINSDNITIKPDDETTASKPPPAADAKPAPKPDAPKKNTAPKGTIRVAPGLLIEAPTAYDDAPAVNKSLVLVRAIDVVMRAKDWLWDGHLLRGALELLTGIPGLGKSQVQCTYVACATTNKAWPNGARGLAAPVSCIMITAEDALDQDLKPRLIAAGANLERVHFLKCIKTDDKNRQFMLSEDLELIEAKLKELGDVGLVTIDPITAYMGKVDTHRTSDVRSQLGPLKDVAENTNAAFSAITHPAKAAGPRAIDHFIGSQAFIAAARVGHACFEEMGIDDRTTGRKLFTHVKHNASMRMPTLAYRVAEIVVGQDPATRTNIAAPHVVWGDAPVDITADAAAAANGPRRSRDGDQREIQQFLRTVLADGEPKPYKDIVDEAQQHGFTVKQLKTAKEKLGVTSEKDGVRGGWMWQWRDAGAL